MSNTQLNIPDERLVLLDRGKEPPLSAQYFVWVESAVQPMWG